ncbi:PA0069 family radical SAM protein [Thioalkalivibrio thiocyanodenitrificans]|uniref:PA0069 family radical SAM protein n=1 Tax=Thioalkalivibrio thiocyanodenitrificans TaxID=243063 RepID=UPI00035E2B7F|nr:PA0069 family radical SAM protein [Thioalkalivibrio thiocyanodenitrificans]
MSGDHRPTSADRAVRGRGATIRPFARYESTHSEPVDDGWRRDDADAPPVRTRVTMERARSVISGNHSPDVPFELSINPYRGCEHGCAYCFARPTHAYMGLSPGLDFETQLFAKAGAAARLREELAGPGYVCRPIALGINTDAYQPLERRLRITRELLEVLHETHHPVTIVTKSSLVERDLDLLAPMAQAGLAQVAVSVTTLDRGLARRMEPRAAAPQRRIETIRRLTDAGVPVSLLVAPLIPVLTDAETEDLLQAGAGAGAVAAGYVLLRLPGEVAPIFESWLRTHEPLRAGHVLSRLRDSHGGRLYDARFGKRMTGDGPYAQLLRQRFRLARRRAGLADRMPALDTGRFTPPRKSSRDGQMDLF